MFSEWRKRSKLFDRLLGPMSFPYITKNASHCLARAAYKAGVRAGIKQEQARRKK